MDMNKAFNESKYINGYEQYSKIIHVKRPLIETISKGPPPRGYPVTIRHDPSDGLWRIVTDRDGS